LQSTQTLKTQSTRQTQKQALKSNCVFSDENRVVSRMKARSGRAWLNDNRFCWRSNIQESGKKARGSAARCAMSVQPLSKATPSPDAQLHRAITRIRRCAAFGGTRW